MDPGLDGRSGSGLSVSLDVRGDVGVGRPIDDFVLIVGLENDNDGSSNDTVCGPFVLTNLPWRCSGVEGLLFCNLGDGSPVGCCRSSSIGEPS